MVTQAIQTAKIVETTSAAQHARRNCFCWRVLGACGGKRQKKIRRVMPQKFFCFSTKF